MISNHTSFEQVQIKAVYINVLKMFQCIDEYVSIQIC